MKKKLVKKFNKETWKKGEIVYSQGLWRCKVVQDYGNTISYIPLEGYAEGQDGKIFTADKSLFVKVE